MYVGNWPRLGKNSETFHVISGKDNEYIYTPPIEAEYDLARLKKYSLLWDADQEQADQKRHPFLTNYIRELNDFKGKRKAEKEDFKRFSSAV